MNSTWRQWVTAIVAVAVVVLSVVMLEKGRSGITLSTFNVGSTPATVYERDVAEGPLVVVAHGFAGSRQLMQAYSLSLAQSGYSVVAFDFEGHGRNPVPMSGDVTAIDGTTALLVAETRRVLAGVRETLGSGRGLALLGHSMATDVIVRAALEEVDNGTPVDAIVGISMFSEVLTSEAPRRLLIINGEWEDRLRTPALAALRQIDPTAQEGDTAVSGDVSRRVVVAPYVEHVGVLYSKVGISESRDWLDDTFGRQSSTPLVLPGLWILLLLIGIVVLMRPTLHLLPEVDVEPTELSNHRFLTAVAMPMVLVPLLGTFAYKPWLPVLVSDYLLVHFFLFGVLQLVIVQVWRQPRPLMSLSAIALMLLFGILLFGIALDRYAASFLPTSGRLSIIALLALGTVPFMLADSYVTAAGTARWWRRVTARVAVIVSLGMAAFLDPDRLIFLWLILPVLLLFFLVHGMLGRWTAQRRGPAAAGIGMGLCLAWALGVSFPQFDAGTSPLMDSLPAPSVSDTHTSSHDSTK